MAKYIVKRLIMAVVAFIAVSAITFFVMNLIPGGPFTSEKAMTKEVIATLTKRYGLDKPIGVQYLNYMGNFLRGDWGVSLKTQREIWPDLQSRFGVSARLGLSALAIATVFGVIFGSISALTRNKWPDRLLVVLTTLGTAIPSFVLATLLMLLFCMQLNLLPIWDVHHPNYILPIISLAVYPMAYITRLTKTSMLDALNQDYITTAKAKGVPESKIIFVHALRNALIPVVTYLGPEVAYIITGSMVVESIFTIPGMGTMFVQSINDRDYPYIMAVTIFLAMLMIIANLITDIVYKIIDPRITFD
ncbi:MAG: ABC transporter permease [Lachnospiraceae bacterium]|uniref:ABC transporter permease n=1 Tax=Candidatus Weimeria bifida TaxID=2599074 RepID=A0A6N7J2M1_9FIRM|nr:ABC transporter permease [Candidatus Weimeria bifida]RRF97325.1 MAG: ABC transporter permease [Lachnospiraceae bacterium]